jgi:hypothetical protein
LPNHAAGKVPLRSGIAKRVEPRVSTVRRLTIVALPGGSAPPPQRSPKPLSGPFEKRSRTVCRPVARQRCSKVPGETTNLRLTDDPANEPDFAGTNVENYLGRRCHKNAASPVPRIASEPGSGVGAATSAGPVCSARPTNDRYRREAVIGQTQTLIGAPPNSTPSTSPLVRVGFGSKTAVAPTAAHAALPSTAEEPLLCPIRRYVPQH